MTHLKTISAEKMVLKMSRFVFGMICGLNRKYWKKTVVAVIVSHMIQMVVVATVDEKKRQTYQNWSAAEEIVL